MEIFVLKTWQYFVSTVGINKEIIEAYIQNQGQKDAGQTKFVFK